MVFHNSQKILFRHCDPAGIVFYPRYVEMINDVVERFFADVLKVPFEDILRDHGVPTVNLSCDFKAPSRLGEDLLIDLRCDSIGRSSLTFALHAMCAEQLRFNARVTLVYVDSQGKSTAWPENIRTTIDQFMEGVKK